MLFFFFFTCTWINSILDRYIECSADCWRLIWHCSAEQEGNTANPIELSQFVNFMKRYNLQSETFVIGPNECKLYYLWLSSPISLCCYSSINKIFLALILKSVKASLWFYQFSVCYFLFTSVHHDHLKHFHMLWNYSLGNNLWKTVILCFNYFLNTFELDD